MTDQYSPQPRKPGRPTNAERDARASSEPEATTRQAETQEVRRRRVGVASEGSLKLHIPNELKDPNYEYRWVNDKSRDMGGRVQQLHAQDWDVAPEMGGTGIGTVTERTVDSNTGQKAVLMRKRKDWYDADKKAEWKALDERDEAMRRGPLPTPEGAGGEADKTYTPGGRNIVNGR